MIKQNFFTKKIFVVVFSFFVGFFIVSSPFLVLAKNTINDADAFLGKTVGPTGVSQEDLSSRFGNIIRGALQLVGVAFLVLMVYGGFRWMTARGDAGQIDTAKETIIAAIIGLIVVVSAYALTQFITSRLIQNKGNDSGSLNGSPEQNPDAPQGCCEFKVNEIPTWTAFMMTEDTCRAACFQALGDDCDVSDWDWDPGVDAAQCDVRRQDGLR